MKFILTSALLILILSANGYAQTCDLHDAVDEGDITAVRTMLDAGCAVDVKNSWGWTPLQWAAGGYRENDRENDPEIVRLLIEAGADTKVVDRHEKTLLHLAVSKPRPEIVRLLLEAGADVNATDIWGNTALHDVPAHSISPDSLITHTMKRTDVIHSVRLLLDAGANVNAKKKDGTTALHSAAQDALILMLVKAGADINARDAQGKTPLMSVVSQSYTANGVRIMLEAGADVNAKDNFGVTPLHHAMIRVLNYPSFQLKFYEYYVDPAIIVRLLLDAGADIDAKTSPSVQPVDPERSPTVGRTALHWAIGTIGVISFNPIWEEASIPLISTLANAGADVNAKDVNGDTPLHLVFEYFEYLKIDNIISTLVDVGADINAKNNEGETPLHIASRIGKADVIPLLLSLGADERIKNNAKFKPNAIGKTRDIRKLLKTPGLHWPIKAYAMGNVSSTLVDTSARIGCLDKKECRVFLDCTDKDGDVFQGSLDSDSKDARAEDSIDGGATVSLSASDIKTITGATGDGALDCALRSQQRITAQVWSSTEPVNANTTAYRLSEEGKAQIQFQVGEANTPFVNIRCLAPESERCTNTKLKCTDDSGDDWPTIRAGTIDPLEVYTVSTVAGADHRIADSDRGWYSCAIKSDAPFMVHATQVSTKGDARSKTNSTSISME